MRLQTASKNTKKMSMRHVPLLKRLNIELRQEKAKLEHAFLSYKLKEMTQKRPHIRISLIAHTFNNLLFQLGRMKVHSIGELGKMKSNPEMKNDVVKALDGQPKRVVDKLLDDHYWDSPVFSKHREHMIRRMNQVWDEKKGWFSKKTIALETRIKKLKATVGK